MEILSLGHQSLKPLLSGPLWSEHNFLYAIKDQGPQLTRGFGITLVWLNQGSIHCRPEEIQKQLFSEKKVSSGTLNETMVSLCLFSIWFLKSAGRLKVTFFEIQKGHITVQWRAGTKRSMGLSTLKVKVVRLSVNLRKKKDILWMETISLHIRNYNVIHTKRTRGPNVDTTKAYKKNRVFRVTLVKN